MTRFQLVKRRTPPSPLRSGSKIRRQEGLPSIALSRKRKSATPRPVTKWPIAAPTATTASVKTSSEREIWEGVRIRSAYLEARR
jgi:hypothetical protein